MRIAALTHVRHDDFFLDLWVRHHGGLLGRENCYVLLDGDDWESGADLSGVNVITIPRHGTEFSLGSIDRKIMRRQLSMMAHLFETEGYEYVFRGDCDEYIVPDPLSGASIEDAAREADKVGLVYSSGIDVLHNSAAEPALDPGQDVMCQRHFGVISQGYCKVNLVGRMAHEKGFSINAGGHRAVDTYPVHISEKFYMLHLGWCDREAWEARARPRLERDRAGSFKEYYDERRRIFDLVAERGDECLEFDSSMAQAREELCFYGGQRVNAARRFSGGNFAYGGARDYLVRLDERFHHSIG